LLAEIDALVGRASALPIMITRTADGQSPGRDAERIGKFWAYPESRTFAELLIDCEEDRTLRAVLVSMLRERQLGA
jgi:hypothetical protein